MVLPLQELADPTVPRNPKDVGSKRGAHSQAIDIKSLLGYAAARGTGGNSDAKDAERGSGCRGWWAAIRTPYAPGIGRQEFGLNIKDDRAVLDYRHLRDNISRNFQAFRGDTIRPARLGHQHRNLGVNAWVIHG
jgi:hypothetical protein